MKIIGLYQCRKLIQGQCPIFFLIERLGLDTSEDGCSPTLEEIGVSGLTNKILVTPTTVRKQGTEITLGSTWNKHTRFFPQYFGRHIFKPSHRWITVHHIISHLRTTHSLPDFRSRLGYGITPQIDRHTSARK